MSTESRKPSGLFWPTLFAALGTLLLFGLGTWQLERKEWKETLVAQIAERMKGEPIILDAAAGLFKAGQDIEYARVRARGRWLTDKTLVFYASTSKEDGFHVYTPLETPAGSILLVNRGFVFGSELARLDQPPPPRTDAVEIVGVLRKPGRQGWFDPDNDVVRNRWYWRDLAGMAKAAFPDGKREILPFFLEAEAQAAAGTGVSPRGGVTRVQFPNRHLEYAMTWYGLGVTLIGVYIAFAWSRRRARTGG